MLRNICLDEKNKSIVYSKASWFCWAVLLTGDWFYTLWSIRATAHARSGFWAQESQKGEDSLIFVILCFSQVIECMLCPIV